MAKYLIRFDDIAPQMNWDIWEKIEIICDRYQIKPLLAVVPDNQDQKLKVAPECSDFWNRVKHWQAKGYSIGIHGYQHRYETSDAGLLGFNKRSEFSGHSFQIQLEKLKKALSIFNMKNIQSDIFIAPGHSFDIQTLKALEELKISFLSDGFFPFPYRRKSKILWIPQQLWKFKPRLFGVWTICYHLNNWTTLDINQFESDIQKYKDSLISFEMAANNWKSNEDSWKYLIVNHLYEKYFHAKRYLIYFLLRVRELIFRRN